MTHGVGTGCSRAKSMYGFAGLSRPSAPQSGQTAKAGPQVACVNPADLAGGSADSTPTSSRSPRSRRARVELPVALLARIPLFPRTC